VNYLPFIVAGIAFVVFLTLGIVTWSYRDVANRHREKTDGATPHDSGH
jgi:heme/copper-type cytochrome/quinol oxidase subunit 2